MSHNLSIGIVGLPNVGKSTLFNLLTKQKVNVANYPFATIDPNVGVVFVPDGRLDKLAKLYPDKHKIPAVVEFCDIAGLVKGAHKGEGLGNQFLAHIRETQVIVIVLRTFEDTNVAHIESTVDPLRDLETINSELALKDLETIEKHLHKVESDVKGGRKGAEEEKELLLRAKESLSRGRLLVGTTEEHPNILENVGVSGLSLLTAKKQIYLLNGKSGDVPAGVIEKIKELNMDYIVAGLATIQELPELIKKAYKMLGLMTFFTIGDNEIRAWTIKEGTRVPQAAGTIHTDFEKNFIRAEVINWQKLLEIGDWGAARQKGLIRAEGKEYVVRDGDVVLVRHG